MIAVGKSADFVILEAPSFRHLAYRPGVDLIQETVARGTAVVGIFHDAHVGQAVATRRIDVAQFRMSV